MDARMNGNKTDITQNMAAKTKSIYSTSNCYTNQPSVTYHYRNQN
jgi:hypothetical protein